MEEQLLHHLEYDVNQEDVSTFFSQYAKVNSVRLPRHVADKRLFCDTVLIEFSTEEDAENVLKKSLVYAGVDLELKPKKEFDEEQAKEVKKLRNFVHICIRVTKTIQILKQSNLEHYMSSICPSVHSKANNHNQIFCTHDDGCYPKALIVGFTLKNAVSRDKNETCETADDSANKVNGELDSTENVTKENEQMGR
ncbi:la protein 1-like [Mangifera indica]|uniref:la protein 1-like n=1 Tax=Mangifera indica TaxID=29780 RepID=UPI001CFA47B1|nr:la protein 1-like [Mangifera indica]